MWCPKKALEASGVDRLFFVNQDSVALAAVGFLVVCLKFLLRLEGLPTGLAFQAANDACTFSFSCAANNETTDDTCTYSLGVLSGCHVRQIS
jgi:hypothetical protein